MAEVVTKATHEAPTGRLEVAGREGREEIVENGINSKW